MGNDNMFGHPFPLAIFVNVGSCEKFKKHLEDISLDENKHGCLILVSYDEGKVEIVKVIQLTDQQHLQLEEGFRTGKSHTFRMRC